MVRSHVAWALAWLALAPSCSTRTTELIGKSQANDASTGGAADAGAGAEDAAPPLQFNDGGVVICGDHLCACSNAADDDGDDLLDGFDPECTGAFDDDEASFATGVHGESKDARCRDCFFDANSGSGDDDCRVAASCGVDGTSDGASGNCATCDVSVTCVNSCIPRTPNGCDCFGCCEVLTEQGALTVRLTETCSLNDIENVSKCPRCLQDEKCKNECGPCELCPGKAEADLPAQCAGYECESAARCGPSLPCAGGGYCQLGCCLPPLI